MADKDIKNLSHTTGGTPEEIEELKAWWNAHGNVVTIALCVVLAVVLGSRWLRSHRENAAAQAMSEFQRAGDAAALEAIVHDNRSAAVTDLARLRLASIHDAAGDWEQAQEAYRAFLDKAPDHFFADIAAFGLAHCAEALGRVDEAAEAFRRFHETDHPDSALAPAARVAQARCLILTGTDQGKLEGKEILDNVMADLPQTPWAVEADEVIRAKDRLTVPPAAGAGQLDMGALFAPAAEAAPGDAPAEPAAEAAPGDAPAEPAAEATPGDAPAEPATEAEPGA